MLPLSLSSDWNFEVALRLANQAMQAQFGRDLSDVEAIILQGAWDGQTYEAIAANSAYSDGYLRRKVGPKLWKGLSAALGEPVSKPNFREALGRYRLNPTASPSVDRPVAVSIAPQVTPKPDAAAVVPSAQQDWGEAIDVSFFLGRSQELAVMHQHVMRDRCRILAVLGMGGMGKTSLAIKFAQQVQDAFEFVIWRSLRNAPSLETILTDCVTFFSAQAETQGTPQTLLHYLRNHRCLLILDNLETLMTAGDRAGSFNFDYEAYGDLLRLLAEVHHQSCLILTSREKPAEVGIFEGADLAVRTLHLQGSQEAAALILQAKGLTGVEAEQRELCDRYSHNPLAIKIVATSIQSLFGGDIGTFLAADDLLVFNGLQRLIDQHFQRLSPFEQTIMFWLAINREWTSVDELRADIIPAQSQGAILAALESLSWRSLIEYKNGQYTQQPVVMEFVTEQLTAAIIQEIINLESRPAEARLSPLHSHALIKTTAQDYVQESQRRLLLAPIAQGLRTYYTLPHLLAQQCQKQLGAPAPTPPLSIGIRCG